MPPETESISWNRSRAALKKDCSVQLSAVNGPPAPFAPPRGPESTCASTLPAAPTARHSETTLVAFDIAPVDISYPCFLPAPGKWYRINTGLVPVTVSVLVRRTRRQKMPLIMQAGTYNSLKDTHRREITFDRSLLVDL